MKRYLLAGTSALALLVGAAGAHADTFDFTGKVVDVTILVSGTYDITAAGAQGGAGFNGAGGLGALAGGDVFLTAGTMLDIAVGGAGGNGGSFSGGGRVFFGGGGGGGSFVYTSLTAPLVVAGAGGAGGAGGFVGVGGPGQQGKDGQNGIGDGAGAGGANGKGGSAGGHYRGSGGGGGGFFGNGGNGNGSVSGGSGFGPTTFAGGGGYAGSGGGGFGGGGGYAGGGGGYVGGGGGGGSFVAADFTNAMTKTGGADNAKYGGNGYVTINLVPAAVPEPGSLGLFAAGLLGLGVARRRRRG